MGRRWVVALALSAVIVSTFAGVGPVCGSQSSKLAQTMIHKIDSFSEKEKEQFISLGKDAADALLPVFVERAKVYDKNPHEDGTDPTDAQCKAETEYTNAGVLLEKVMTKDQTAQMLDLLDDFKDTWVRSWITRMVARRGDTKLAAPVFFNMFKSGQTDALSEEAKQVIWSSGNSEVTDYLIKLIKDPKANPWDRRDAYINAARTGSEAAANAILSVRNTQRTIPPIAELMELDKLTTEVTDPGICDHPVCAQWIQLIGKKVDKNGIIWGLVACGVIGTTEDLWIVRHNGQHWTSPLFTGKTFSELGKADWFEAFVNNPELAKDSDWDGWTDLVEKRLGTDPHKADTDRDGLIDSQDMNPLAAPRKLSQTEQILQAAYEAVHEFQENGCTPSLITLPKGTKPFEANGWGWITIAQTPGAKLALLNYTGKGMESVSFRAPDHDFAGKEIKSQSNAPIIVFNSAHTAAKLQIALSYHPLMGRGYDMELKKIKGQWFVVKMQMAWIS